MMVATFRTLTTLTSLLLVMSLTSIAKADQIGTRLIQLDPVWSFELREDEAVQFLDKDSHYLHANLMGAVTIGRDGIVVYDEITNKLVRFDEAGTRLWSTGQIGEGPEDHNLPCEPLAMNSGMVALASYSNQPKLVYHDTDGSYQSSLSLPGYLQFHRLTISHNTIYAVSHRQHGQISSGLDIEVYIATIDEAGLPQNEHLVNTATWKSWRRGEVVQEVDFWIKPRVYPGPRGTLIAQPDVFSPDIEVYNSELEVLYEIQGNWEAEDRPQAEIDDILERSKGAKIPCPKLPAIPHMFVIKDSEIWLQKTAPGQGIRFATYHVGGQYIGDVEFPPEIDHQTEMQVRNDLLLCYSVIEDGHGGVRRQQFSLYEIRVD